MLHTACTDKTKWFEYHCLESPTSSDSHIWARSHQRITVLRITEAGGGDTPQERGERGEPRVYAVKFSDGFVCDVFEDEVLDSPSQFYRPSPNPSAAK